VSDQKKPNKPISLEKAMNLFMRGVRHSMELGMTLEEISDEGLVLRLPYSDKIVGNPETGVIHGGAITSLMDQACGLAVAQSIWPDFDISPTIDLRIDYMRAADPHKDVLAYVTAYRKTRNVVFARGIAYQDDRNEPIAHCVANFMRMGLNKVPWKKSGSGEANDETR
jgi:uncharacterized protein (TIGR00369 family)